MAQRTTLTERAAASQWVAAQPGLADAIDVWERDAGPERDQLAEEAADVASPGPLNPLRAARHLAAMGLARSVRIATNLPTDLAAGTPVRDPQGWLRRGAVQAFVDQLVAGGPPGLEIARLIRNAGDLFPSELVSELETRHLEAPRLHHRQVERIARRSFPDLVDIDAVPLTRTPVSQLHAATGAHGQPLAVRVRRPGFHRNVRDDARILASLLGPMERLVPAGGMGPSTFVQLTVRQALEAADLRFEALGLAELGLVGEELGVDAISVARPARHDATRWATLIERPAGRPLGTPGTEVGQPAEVLGALVTLSLEAAITHGTFWADPAPEHLLVDDSGAVTLVGASCVGRLSVDQQRGGILFLKALFTGDPAGQVEAMQAAGALNADTDTDGLLREMEQSEAMSLMSVLSGGESGLLGAVQEAIRLLLRYRLAPPLEVVLLVRTMFSLGRLSSILQPEGNGLFAALLPMAQRLPALLEEL